MNLAEPTRRQFCRGAHSLALTALAGVMGVVSSPTAVGAAAEFRPRVETLVVTGMREQRLAELPRSATVITAEDIDLSPAVNIVDLIAREANLNLRSTVGNEKFSGVDIRGQGDTYTSNVIVMVDGIRLNAEDLSGADFSVIPLDQIDRVEIIRGANTVRYGNGAIGGVINIITKQPTAGKAANARVRVGSYRTFDSGLDVSRVGESVYGSAAISYYNSDGYRDNGKLQKRDGRLLVGVKPRAWLDAALSATLHRDEFGLPGPVSRAAFNGSDAQRRASDPLYADDGGSTHDDRLRADLHLGDQASGVAHLAVVHRQRNNPFVLGGMSGLISEDSDRADLQYALNGEAFGLDQALFAGLVVDQADYLRRLGEPAVVDTQTKRGDVRHRAWFVAADLHPVPALQVSLGYRADRFKLQRNDSEYSNDICDDLQQFGSSVFCNDPGGFRSGEVFSPQRNSWHNDALEAGLIYSLANHSSWFIAYAKSFRNPNIDELALADADLGPQTGRHLDAGVRAVIANQLELSLAVFYAVTDDEILFAVDKATGNLGLARNFNSPEQTDRRGGEVDLRWYVSDTLTLTGNAGYTRAMFKDSHATLPLVPRWTGGLGAQALLADDLSLTVNANYVGSRFDGNDFNNQSQPKVGAYQVVDAKLVYQRNDWQWFAGVANLFNEVYAASVYSSSFYPMPDRNFYAGFSIRLDAPG